MRGEAVTIDSGRMSIKGMINEIFPLFSFDNWTQKAEETLKGKSLDTLTRNTYENIKLKPLYSKEDTQKLVVSQFPGYPDYRRGFDSLGYITNDWKIAQTIVATDSKQLQEKLKSAFQKGQSAISFEVSEQFLKDVPKILDHFIKRYPFSLNAKTYQSQLLTEIGNLAEEQGIKEEITGYIANDPIANLVEGGNTFVKTSIIYEQWSDTIRKAAENFPNIKTILVDTTPYHNSGANAVQELAIALATAVNHIRLLTERGLSLEILFSKIVFEFSIGANFFMEIAKLRAAKLLWGKIGDAYGVDIESHKMLISARTSKFTKTKYDPNVNLLRAGSEAFAAIIGGIQYLHVSPYNEPEGDSTAFSDRIARNTQLILREEAYLKKIVDPAGGSWYIESLTNELAEKAWELFLEIDDNGGIIETLKSNWLQEQILTVKTKRLADIFTRKQSLIGTNVYASLMDQPLHLKATIKPPVSKNKQGETIHSLPQERLAEPWEKLRSKSEQLRTQNGVDPAVGLICLGELMDYKARADFITGFLAPGGIQVVNSPLIHTAQAAVTFVKNSRHNYFCLCGSDQTYETLGLILVRELKKQFPGIKLYCAGIPSNEGEWFEAGVSQCIHVKSNCYQTLLAMLEEMEVK